MWDNEKSYEYTEDEVRRCKELKHLLICNPPQKIVSLENSCMFSLAKNLSKRCTVIPTSVAENKFVLQDNYLTYFVQHNSTQMITEVCPGGHSRTSEIKNSGTIKLPHKCKLLINGIMYENKLYHNTYRTYNRTPTFFEPNFLFKIKHSRKYTTPSPNTDSADTFLQENQQNLKIASDILGNFEIAPDHLIIASISFTTMLVIVSIAIIVLYCIVCGPRTGTIRFLTPSHPRARIHKNSMSDP